MIGVLFVCMGNICRSPMADGIFSELVISNGLQDLIVVDSAGTHDYHAGKSPDPNSINTAMMHGINISYLIARAVEPIDFEAFEYIVAMDKNNLEFLQGMCPSKHKHKVSLLLKHTGKHENLEVMDPYGKNVNNFNQVYDLIDNGVKALFAHIVKEKKLHIKKDLGKE